MNEIILKCNGVKKEYKTPSGPVEVLKGVDFELRKGEMVFIQGRSGAGKSTLLHILGGLDMPSEGTVSFRNVVLAKLGQKKIAEMRNKKIGFVFQFYHLLPELNVVENVMLPGMIGRKKVKDKAHVLLEILGLEERKEHFPYQLSGGEQQRVALARALINSPDIVFCDEPTGNLDEENAEKIYTLMYRINKTEKQTFCIVTHEESLARQQQHVLRLKEGILVKERI